jgi:hypothetical protein
MARMDARMKSHEAKIEASNRNFFARKDYDRKSTEAYPEEEEPASVDMKPEAAEQQEEVPVEDATVRPVVEPEETTSVTRKETMACQEMEDRLEEK